MITKDELASRLLSACAEVKAAEGELTEIDSRFGDADHGLTMCKIATAIEESVRESEGGIQAMLDDVAMAVMTLNGGSAVPLWNTWLDGLQEAAPEGNEADSEDLKAMFANALAELSDISGAQVGDKTLMDAFVPAIEAIQACEGNEAALFEAAAHGSGALQGLPIEVRPREKLRREDHRHAGRRGGQHGLLLQGACAGVALPEGTGHGIGSAGAGRLPAG